MCVFIFTIKKKYTQKTVKNIYKKVDFYGIFEKTKEYF